MLSVIILLPFCRGETTVVIFWEESEHFFVFPSWSFFLCLPNSSIRIIQQRWSSFISGAVQKCIRHRFTADLHIMMPALPIIPSPH